MHSHEHSRSVANLTADERDVLQPVEQVSVADRDELTVGRRQARLADARHELLTPPPVGDHVTDRQHLHAVSPGERKQGRQARHLAVVCGDLADDRDGWETRQRDEID